MVKVVFLDRDGVINELVYHQEQGIVNSPLTAEQFKLCPNVTGAIKRLQKAGYKVVVASNQPCIAKGYISKEAFWEIRKKMIRELVSGGAFIDNDYYCFHHPDAKLKAYRIDCECRKPKSGLLLKASREMNIDLSESWMVGDGLTDVQAGKGAGCRTILIGKQKCEVCKLMDELDARPDAILSDLGKATEYILKQGD